MLDKKIHGLNREVVTKDSTNVYAQMMLAKGSIISGQYDKAASRLELINQLTPGDIDASLMLADVYERLGEKQKAINWYQKSAPLAKEKELPKQKLFRQRLLFASAAALLILVLVGVALLLNQEFKGRALVRTAVLVPWAIPTIVSAKMWGWMLNDQFGVINTYLLALGVISHKIAWTAEPTYALWTVVLVDVWKTTPFMALLILAALQTVPKDCYEAARVDGVHPLRVFWKITLPLIRQPLLVAVVFRLLDSLRVFDLIYVLTANGSTTISMSGFVRREMVEYGNMGYGSAASTSLFLIILLTAIVFLKLARVKLSEDAQ